MTDNPVTILGWTLMAIGAVSMLGSLACALGSAWTYLKIRRLERQWPPRRVVSTSEEIPF